MNRIEISVGKCAWFVLNRVFHDSVDNQCFEILWYTSWIKNTVKAHTYSRHMTYSRNLLLFILILPNLEHQLCFTWTQSRFYTIKYTRFPIIHICLTMGTANSVYSVSQLKHGNIWIFTNFTHTAHKSR